MNKIFIFTILLLFSCSVKENVKQNSSKTLAFEIEQSIFDENIYNVELFIEIPKNALIFKKEFDAFVSNITIDIAVLNNEDKNIYTYSWDESIVVDFYEDTKSRSSYTTKHLFQLKSGEYAISIIANDFENHNSFVNEGDFTVSNNFITQNIFNIYYKKNFEYLSYIEELETPVDTLWFKFDYNQYKKIENERIILQCGFYLDNKVVKEETIIDQNIDSLHESDKNLVFYPIPITEESFNKLKIELIHNSQIKTRIFNFKNMIKNNFDLNTIIGAMQYVLDFSEYLYFSNLNLQEQIQYIKDFWEINNFEDMEESELAKFKEFYSRVQYVNKHFSFFNKNGWQSDRGKIYIIHGKPKDIRYEFNEKGEFEFWYYSGIKKFTFINKYGTYELYHENR